jgi:ATP-dependent DNA ligase
VQVCTSLLPAVTADGECMELPVEPMLAAAVDEVPDRDALPGGTVWEPKWDGFRCIAGVEAGAVRLLSRRARELTRFFPDVAAAIERQLTGPLVLDGELVVWVGGRLEFAAAQERLVAGARLAELVRTQPASYVVFDLLAADGADLTAWPWWRRRARLDELMAGASPPLQLSPVTADRDEALLWFETWASRGVEGLVAKGRDQPYRPGRRGWLKTRHRRSTEAVVGAVDGPLRAPDRLVLGAFDAGGVLRIVGTTSAIGPRDAQAIGGLLRPAVAGHPWPDELPSSLMGGLAGQRPPRPVTLVEPTLVVEVAADTFDRGRFRHAVRWVRTRADLDPRQVRIGEHGPETRW